MEDTKENVDENKEAAGKSSKYTLWHVSLLTALEAPLTSWADIVLAHEQRSSSPGLKERPPRLSWDRKRKTPEEILREQEEKLAKAQKIRETNQSNIVAKAKNSTAKVIEKVPNLIPRNHFFLTAYVDQRSECSRDKEAIEDSARDCREARKSWFASRSPREREEDQSWIREHQGERGRLDQRDEVRILRQSMRRLLTCSSVLRTKSSKFSKSSTVQRHDD